MRGVAIKSVFVVVLGVGLVMSGCLGSSNNPPDNHPKARIQVDTPVPDVGEVVHFDGSLSTDDKDIVEYLWDFGDGESASGVKVSHAYSSEGNFSVFLTIKDVDGQTDKDMVVIHVAHLVQTKNIAIACVNIAGTSNYMCTVVNADTGVDFTLVDIYVLYVGTADNRVVSDWSAPISYQGGVVENDSASPPVFSGKVVDNGDGSFGVGDDIFLRPVSGSSLSGLTVELFGGGARGSSTLP